MRADEFLVKKYEEMENELQLTQKRLNESIAYCANVKKIVDILLKHAKIDDNCLHIYMPSYNHAEEIAFIEDYILIEDDDYNDEDDEDDEEEENEDEE